MKWNDIDKKYRKRGAPKSDGHMGWNVLRDYVDYLLTYYARATVGLDAGSLDVEPARGAVQAAYHQAFMTFGFGAGGSKQDSEYWKGVCALLGAALNDPELVATCSGGKTLGAKVQQSKTYVKGGAHDLRGLARHLATAARARLPASHVAAAMTPVRDDFAADKLRDPRTALVAAHAYLVHVGGEPNPAEACRAWLDGKPLDLPEGSAVQHVADGEDPRAKIFEQFQERLADDKELASATEQLAKPYPYPFDYRVFLPDEPSEAATLLFLARQPLPKKWESLVDPYVARWLGGKVTDDAIAKRRKEQQRANREFHDKKRIRAYVIRQMSLDPAIRALHLGDVKVLAGFTGGGELSPFKPGKYFKDDWRKLLRYLGAAAALPKSKRATRADVEPAWFDFLSRKQTDHVWWAYLLAIQAVITVNIGGGDPSTVGRDLQRVITGV